MSDIAPSTLYSPLFSDLSPELSWESNGKGDTPPDLTMADATTSNGDNTVRTRSMINYRRLLRAARNLPPINLRLPADFQDANKVNGENGDQPTNDQAAPKQQPTKSAATHTEAALRGRVRDTQDQLDKMHMKLDEANVELTLAKSKCEVYKLRYKKLLEMCRGMKDFAQDSLPNLAEAIGEFGLDSTVTAVSSERPADRPEQPPVPRKPEQPDDIDARTLKQALNKPPPFTGNIKGKLPIRDWLTIVKHYLDTLNIPDSIKVATAVSYLQEEALRYWNFRKQLMADEAPPKDPNDWQCFTSALTERFDAGNTPVAARYKLDKLFQKRQSMASFIQEFDQVCSYIPNMTDDEKVHTFLTHVRTEVSDRIKTDPKTGKRWSSYNTMRAYALNEFADYNFTAHTDLLERVQRNGLRLSFGDNNPRPAKKTRSSSSGSMVTPQQGTKRINTSNNITIKPRNPDGSTISRPKQVVDYCNSRNQCAYCYGSKHTYRQCKKDKPYGTNTTLPKSMVAAGYFTQQ